MGQLILELDEQTEALIKQSTSKSGLSISAWIIQVIKAQTTSLFLGRDRYPNILTDPVVKYHYLRENEYKILK